jgi:hypothetical protein
MTQSAPLRTSALATAALLLLLAPSIFAQTPEAVPSVVPSAAPASVPPPLPPTPPAPTAGATSVQQEDPGRWWLYLYGGLSFGHSSNVAVRSSGTTLVNTSEKLKNVPALGAEVSYQHPSRPFGVSLLAERGEAQSKNSSGPADSELGVYGMLSLSKRKGDLRLWAGAAAGLVFLSLAESSTSSGGFRISASEQSFSGLGLSPRAGLEYLLWDGFRVGLQGAFVTYTASSSASLVEIATGKSANLSYDVNRTWWSAALRLGIEL